MKTLQFETTINAPKQKVWSIMIDDSTYREWTEVFSPGGYYEGSWDKGSKILFLGPGEDGKLSGMVSKIVENKPYDFISIEHYGEVRDGVEDTTSERVKLWSGAHENYYFSEENGATKLKVTLDTVDEYAAMFDGLWPKALDKLKEICERA